jgi:inositol phosphorylceramide mannosyltransferase catalytic subunit
MIPKNIFQSWISKDLHPEVQKKVNTIKELNPEYNYQLYDDSDIDEFVNTFYPGKISECFNRLNIPVAKVDFWRYLILYEYGGVYVDLDSSIDISLDDFIRENDTAIVTAETNPNTFVQWALIFDKQHPILKKVIELVVDNIENNLYPNDVLQMTGPQVYSKAIMSFHKELFGKKINFNSINHNTDVRFSKDSISYRIYGIDYNNKFTFKTEESEYLYIEKEPWRNELAKKELLHPKLNVDNVYICHYKKLEERKKSILEQFKEEKIYAYEFVENFDKTEWNIKEIEKEYPKVFKDWKKGLESYDDNAQNSERSLALKHASILKNIFKNQYKASLILEDDVTLCNNFIEYCNYFISQLPDDWDIAWVGSCLNLHEPTVEDKYVYKTSRGSRCTHAFLVSKSMVNKVIDYISDINLPSDHFYNYLIQKFNLNNYWFEPSLARQSLDFCSSISGNYWNQNNIN